jgi:hypothetical protein
MKLSDESEQFMFGRIEGLSEAIDLVERALARGESMEWALYKMLEAADRTHVARSYEFDDEGYEFVPRSH